MIKVSELLSKQLICLTTASVVGTIGNITFDPKLTRGKLLELFADDDNEPEMRFVSLARVSAFDGDACIVKTPDCIQNVPDSTDFANNPINCEGYNQDGKALGKVRDVLLDGATVTKLLVGESEFSPKELLAYSRNLLIFNDTGKPYKLPKPKTVPTPEKGLPRSIALHSFSEAPDRQSAAMNHDAANVIATESPDKVDIPAKIPQANTQVSRSPASGETAYRFLLGKPVHSDITDANGRVLIASGTLVNEEVIRFARDNGKLVQLALRAY